jgi:hypothetical protein
MTERRPRASSSSTPEPPIPAAALPLWEEPSGFLAALEAAAPPAGPPEPPDPAAALR